MHIYADTWRRKMINDPLALSYRFININRGQLIKYCLFNRWHVYMSTWYIHYYESHFDECIARFSDVFVSNLLGFMNVEYTFYLLYYMTHVIVYYITKKLTFYPFYLVYGKFTIAAIKGIVEIRSVLDIFWCYISWQIIERKLHSHAM